MSDQKGLREIFEAIDIKSTITRVSIFIVVILLIGMSLRAFFVKKYMGEEVARLTINEFSTTRSQAIIKDTSLLLQAGEVLEIWSEMSVKYKEDSTILNITNQSWDGLNWNNNSRRLYEYDEGGNRTSELLQAWEDGD